MKPLFYLIHPAHYHLFKNVINRLNDEGYSTTVLIKKKDILEELLKNDNVKYFNILPEGRKNSKLQIALGLFKQDFRLLTFCLKNRSSLLIGTSVSIAHIGWLLRIPSFIVNEDDANVVPLFSKLGYPFATKIISPDVCNNGKWGYKTIKYNSYHELAYLHPENFKPQKSIVNKYINTDRPYVLMRFSGLGAHHDFGVDGIDDKLALELINIIEPHANIYITSERNYGKELEKYRLPINPLDIHHVLSYATMYIGDSQTMAAESAVLGVPSIRFNDFVGKIGYLNDLENNYKLGFGLKPNKKRELIELVKKMIKDIKLKENFQRRRELMLSDKVNFSDYLYDLITSKK